MVVSLWIFFKVEKPKNNSLSCSPTTSRFYKRKHRGVTYPKSKRSDHFTPYLITFPLAYKGLFLLMDMRRKDTSSLLPWNFFSNPFFCIDNLSQSALLGCQMFKQMNRSGHLFLIYLEDLGKHESLPPPWQISSATVCFPFVPIIGEQERNECLLKTEFMTRDQPSSARLMNAQVSMPHTCGFSFQRPTFHDVLSMCLTYEGKEWTHPLWHWQFSIRKEMKADLHAPVPSMELQVYFSHPPTSREGLVGRAVKGNKKIYWAKIRFWALFQASGYSWLSK